MRRNRLFHVRERIACLVYAIFLSVAFRRTNVLPYKIQSITDRNPISPLGGKGGFAHRTFNKCNDEAFLDVSLLFNYHFYYIHRRHDKIVIKMIQA